MRNFVLALLVAAALCAGTARSEAVTFVNVATGSTGGTYYPVGAAMAKVWNDSISDMRANAQSTGGTAQNLSLLSKGEAEVIFADGLYYFAYEGKGMFEGRAMKNLRAIAPLYAEPIHFLVAKDSGIKSIKDLKGKRVSVGAVGSGTEITVRALLAANLRMRPDRIILGETRGAEAMELLKAWNTGHPGGICTIHANSATSALSRLETLILESNISGMTLPFIRSLIADAVNLVVHVQKDRRIGPVVSEVLEVLGLGIDGAYRTSVVEKRKDLNIYGKRQHLIPQCFIRILLCSSAACYSSLAFFSRYRHRMGRGNDT